MNQQGFFKYTIPMSINLSHLKKLIATMIPILIAQVSTVGMNFISNAQGISDVILLPPTEN